MLTLDAVTFARGDFGLSADWSLEAGARCAVLGPSGGGKSTLLALIAGFEVPASGHILHDGRAMPEAPGARPLSILFQEANLFPHLSVAQNVGLGLDPRLKLSASDKARVGDVLSRVGMSDLASRKPGALSGGQRARTALARVLLRARPILLLDEAFSALGPALKAEMFALMDETLAPETILMMVTHDPDEAAKMDQIVVVDGGLAAAPQEANPLLANPPPGLRAYLGT